MQMSLAAGWCNLRCRFCWRNIEAFTDGPVERFDNETFIRELRREHSRLLTGYTTHPSRRGIPIPDPRHCTISLGGEPTLHPQLQDAVSWLLSDGLTVFVVTNGLAPNVISTLNPLPTQLYISMHVHSEAEFQRLCRPRAGATWSTYLQGLEVASELSCRRVVRVTVFHGYTLDVAHDIARLIRIASPDYIEVKAFENVGGAPSRMAPDAAPTLAEVTDIAAVFCGDLGYRKSACHTRSRAVLLSHTDEDERKRFIGAS